MGTKSPESISRRNLLKWPSLCWLTSFVLRNRLLNAMLPAVKTTGNDSLAISSGFRSLSLSGIWELTYGPCPDAPRDLPQTAPPVEWSTIQATVPGNVELDLVAAGKMEPLERGNRVYQALNLESYQWWYRRRFSLGRQEPYGTASLVFEGLDCLATIWLNGKLAGKSANMLIPHRFDVTSLLLPDAENEILVRIDPAAPAGKAFPRSAWDWAQEGCWESLHIRKAPHMYGWDIMPRIISAGLWRDVRLETALPVYITSVYWFTRNVDPGHNKATVAVSWEISGHDSHTKGFLIEVEIQRGGRTVFRQNTAARASKGHIDCDLSNVELWWPRGYGEQPLYDAIVRLRNTEGTIADQSITRLGIRTLELDRTDILAPDGSGRFGLVVNGVPVFARGADYGCLDALHSRDLRHLDSVFPILLELNCNMARCWGGNVYPEDRFFDLCDQGGIMVWQDFAMACAIYPQDEAFLQAIKEEVKAVVPRLRNHASLALWCGNNECDDAFAWAENDGRPPIDPNRDRITREVIPAVLKELDPQRSYLPSSPYHSPAVYAAGNKMDSMPEVHLWGPRGYFKAPFYTSSPARFVSEIGYHGCPARASLERMLDPEFVQPWVVGHVWNDEWLTKSVRSTPTSKHTVGRNDLMINQIKAFFGAVPDNLDDFVLASQITQAEALKFFIELFRQRKGTKQGIIWWNLRDGWPILSDAVVDYYNTRKLAFYYLQRVQRDVQAICCEAVDKKHPVVVVNDTLKKVRGSLEIARAGQDGERLLQTEFEVAPNGKSEVSSVPQPQSTEMWRLHWKVDGAGMFKSHYLSTSGPVTLEQYKEWRRLPDLLPV